MAAPGRERPFLRPCIALGHAEAAKPILRTRSVTFRYTALPQGNPCRAFPGQARRSSSFWPPPTLKRDRVMALLAERHQAVLPHEGEVIDALGDFTDSRRPHQRSRLAELIAHRLQYRWAQ